MSGSVYRRTLGEHRLPILWWVLGTAALAGFVVALFPAIAASPEMEAFMEAFPPELLALFGVDPAVFRTAAGYLQAQFYAFAAPILVVVLAVRLGGRLTAGEERSGTIDLLLANPVTRDRVVVEKLAALATLVGLVAVAVAAVLLAANGPAGLGLPVAGILGMNLGLLLVALLFGTLAAALGAWSGRTGTATGITAGVAAATFLVEGFAPLVEGLATLRRASPFHWYQAGDPLLTGFTGNQALLAGVTLVLAAAATVLFRRRDLGVERRLPRPRLRWAPRARTRVRLPALLGGVYGKTLWERRVSIWWWTGGLMALAYLTASFWPTVAAGQDALAGLMEAMPRQVLALFGFSDPGLLLTPAGFVSSRVYTGLGLILVIAFAIGLGSSALAGEEADGTMDLLLANPIPRSRVVVEKYLAMATLVGVVALGLTLAVTAGNRLVGLGLDPEGVAAANLGLVLLALLFGGLALAAGAATGRTGLAVGVSGGVAATGYVLNGIGAIVEGLGPVRPVSPFYWYLGDATPLATGFSVWFLLLAAGALALPALAVIAFGRRSLAV